MLLDLLCAGSQFIAGLGGIGLILGKSCGCGDTEGCVFPQVIDLSIIECFSDMSEELNL